MKETKETTMEERLEKTFYMVRQKLPDLVDEFKTFIKSELKLRDEKIIEMIKSKDIQMGADIQEIINSITNLEI